MFRHHFCTSWLTDFLLIGRLPPCHPAHQTASHTFTKIAVSWEPSRILTAPYRIEEYNIQSLLEDAKSGDRDVDREEEEWVDQGNIDVPDNYPQSLALTWFSTQLEPSRKYRFRVRARSNQVHAGNGGWSAFGAPSEPLGVKRKL